MKYSDTLRLIKAININKYDSNVDHVKQVYDIAVETFKNKQHE